MEKGEVDPPKHWVLVVLHKSKGLCWKNGIIRAFSCWCFKKNQQTNKKKEVFLVVSFPRNTNFASSWESSAAVGLIFIFFLIFCFPFSPSFSSYWNTWSENKDKDQKDCGSIGPGGIWNDDRCSHTNHWICEKSWNCWPALFFPISRQFSVRP